MHISFCIRIKMINYYILYLFSFICIAGHKRLPEVNTTCMLVFIHSNSKCAYNISSYSNDRYPHLKFKISLIIFYKVGLGEYTRGTHRPKPGIQIHFHSKRPHTRNDYINIDSTIAGSMNARS